LRSKRTAAVATSAAPKLSNSRPGRTCPPVFEPVIGRFLPPMVDVVARAPEIVVVVLGRIVELDEVVVAGRLVVEVEDVDVVVDVEVVVVACCAVVVVVVAPSVVLVGGTGVVVVWPATVVVGCSHGVVVVVVRGGCEVVVRGGCDVVVRGTRVVVVGHGALSAPCCDGLTANHATPSKSASADTSRKFRTAHTLGRSRADMCALACSVVAIPPHAGRTLGQNDEHGGT
jgi:hypothetical protein